MKAVRTGPGRYFVEFGSEEELREEHRTSLAHGGLRLPAVETPDLDESGRSNWDRLRALARTDKDLLAPKADRTEQLALVHNPKTPPLFALRIVPTLPEAEVKAIARGAATSMALNQAALKRPQGGG